MQSLTINLSAFMLIAISNVSFFSNGKHGWSRSSACQSPPTNEFLIEHFSARRGLKWKAMSQSSSPPQQKFTANLQTDNKLHVTDNTNNGIKTLIQAKQIYCVSVKYMSFSVWIYPKTNYQMHFALNILQSYLILKSQCLLQMMPNDYCSIKSHIVNAYNY